MRIGEFAKLNDVSTDTIRYYMELELIVPMKVGGQYHFTPICQKDLDLILTFKRMGFTLPEIRRILYFRVISRLNKPEEQVHYKGYYSKTLQRVESELERLTLAKELLLEGIESLDGHSRRAPVQIGLSLDILPMLACPRCGNDLRIHQADVRDGKIMEGSLVCACQNVLRIQQGILCAGACRGEAESNGGEDRVDYYESTSDQFISKLYATSRWIRSVGEDNNGEGFFSRLKGKTVLEPGVGSAYALSQYAHLLPDTTAYLAVDMDFERLLQTKSYLETEQVNFDLVLMCADLEALPLKQGCVDAVMDMSGTSNVAFLSENFLLDTLLPYLKPTSEILGTYIICEGFKPGFLTETQRRYFNAEFIRERLQSLGFQIAQEHTTRKISEGGPYETFVDQVGSTWTYSCHARRHMK